MIKRLTYYFIIPVGFIYLSLSCGAVSNKVTVHSEKKEIGQFEIFELDFKHLFLFGNPWEDVTIETKFHHEKGKTITVGGFFYNSGWWKSRFAPTMPGKWSYTYSFKVSDKVMTGSGSFVCIESSLPGFLRLYSKNPSRFVYDNGTPVYPLGFGSCNGRQHISSYSEGGFGFDGPDRWKCESDQNRNLPPCGRADIDTYFKTYSEIGFNIYRFSNANCCFRIYDPYSTHAFEGIQEEENFYREDESRWVDTLLQKLKGYGFRVIFVPIHSHPRPKWTKDLVNIRDPIKINAWKRYLKYCVDRWSAYVDIWEIFNEYNPNPAWFEEVVPYLKKIDPYHHPITSNPAKPSKIFDILTSHQYNGALPGNMDQRIISSQVYKELKFREKPFLYTEYGNRAPYSNYHPTRFRVYIWTAFMNRIGLVFWNNSFAKYDTGGKGLKNMYIGPEERAMAKVFFDFTSDFPIDHVPATIELSEPSKARSYGLKAQNELIAYLYHFANRPNTLSGRENDTGPILSGLEITIDVPEKANFATWIDPITGKTINSHMVETGRQTLKVPDFMIDIAIRVQSKKI